MCQDSFFCCTFDRSTRMQTARPPPIRRTTSTKSWSPPSTATLTGAAATRDAFVLTVAYLLGRHEQHLQNMDWRLMRSKCHF
jgi:hypothetical protein